MMVGELVESWQVAKLVNTMSGLDHQNDNSVWRKHKDGTKNPAIMESIHSLPPLCPQDQNSNAERSSPNHLSLHGVSSIDQFTGHLSITDINSFMLIDGHEYLKVSNADQFIRKLQCTTKNLKVKVVSIFGNTGDGKSHTLNQTFFNGSEVFPTSNSQSSCTLGIFAAFDPNLNVICLDTEGLLGITEHESVRTRLLLKVLALSDIIIYRTRSERLHMDMYTFLGSASRAYSRYFHSALQAVGQQEGGFNSVSALGPAVIIFHETKHTVPLRNNGIDSPEDIIRTCFSDLKLEIEAYSSIKYIGVQSNDAPTNFQPLKSAVVNELHNTTVRSPRNPQIVFNTLKILNDKFSGTIVNVQNIFFPDQYFTCPVKCHSCDRGCQNSMGHLKEGKPHQNDARCRYQHQFLNKMYLCKKCYSEGKEVQVTERIQAKNDNSWYSLAKFAWSGYVIECTNCGEIYRSRQHWYGNKNPEDSVVRTEITHVWTVESSTGYQNTAQRVLDGVSYITGAVQNASLEPTRAVGSWVADQLVNPSYWRPNNEIYECYKCKTPFGNNTKHHCRACGEGFCHGCSSKEKCVPERQWYNPVRVCDICFSKDSNSNEEDSPDVSVRKVSEQVASAMSAVGSVINYSKTVIKDSARPTYWVPDSEIVECFLCNEKFSYNLPLHHCRDCGRGVCDSCSPHLLPVLRRGWEYPVRVCNACIKID